MARCPLDAGSAVKEKASCPILAKLVACRESLSSAAAKLEGGHHPVPSPPGTRGVPTAHGVAGPGGGVDETQARPKAPL